MDEKTRLAVAAIKRRFLAWREPPVELPAESVIADAVREVAALLVATPQPIETAPRDGTEIIGIWEWATVEFAAIMWWRNGDSEWEEGWWGYISSVTQILYDGSEGHKNPPPTHWLPYESPPFEDAG